MRLQDNLVKGALLFSKYRANEKAGEVIRLTPCNCIEVKRLYEKDITLIFYWYYVDSSEDILTRCDNVDIKEAVIDAITKY